MELYPIRFKTIYKDKLWGGNKIKSVLGKDYGDLPNCGETWEISGVEGNVSLVANGHLQGADLRQLIGQYKEKLVGKKVWEKFGKDFPLLIKFIDANYDLSIQVHPDDELAARRHNSFGKTEMWYVMQADDGASLISGFNQEVDKEKYLDYFNRGKLTDLLNEEQVRDHDVFFLPAGRVHTIGKGLLIAEIQQTSDITYRIYDFDRKDAEGNLRELHVEEALEAIDFRHYDTYRTEYENSSEGATEIVRCQYFHTNKINIRQEMTRDYDHIDSFVILIGISGGGVIETNGDNYEIGKGQTLLIPASFSEIRIVPEGELTLLETYVP